MMKTAGPIDMPRNFPVNSGIMNTGKNPGKQSHLDPFEDFPSLLGSTTETIPEPSASPLNSKPNGNESLSEGFYVKVDVPSLESATEQLPEEMQTTIAELNGLLQPGLKLEFDDPTGAIKNLAEGLRAGGNEVSVSDTFGAPVKQQPLFTVTDKAQMHLASLNALAEAHHGKPSLQAAPADNIVKPQGMPQPGTASNGGMNQNPQQNGFLGSAMHALTEPTTGKTTDGDTSDSYVRMSSVLPSKPSQIQVLVPVTSSIGNFAHTIAQAAGNTDATQTQLQAPVTAQQPSASTTQPTVRSLEIQLVPKSLGVVEVRMTIADGQLNIAVQAQSADAEKIIQSELKSIGEALAKSGLAVEEISVTHNPNLEQNSANQRGQRHDTESQLDFDFTSTDQFSDEQQASSDSENDSLEAHASRPGNMVSADSKSETRSGIYL